MEDKLKILAVEDVETNLAMLEFMLADLNAAFLRAGNGRQALDLLERNPDTDIILLDLVMPVMDGFETLTRLKGSDRFREIPVIVITAGKDEILRTLALGANDFLPKPADPAELKLRILNHARSRQLSAKHKQVEESLKTERRLLAGIIEGTNVGTWEWNVQTGETVFNARWAEIVGYTVEEISPVSIETWLKLAHPDDVKVSGEQLEKHFRGELNYYEAESRMRHKDGNWVWVLDRGKVATWTEDGAPLLMLGTHQDITDRKQADQELRTTNHKLAEAIARANQMAMEAEAASAAKSEFLANMT